MLAKLTGLTSIATVAAAGMIVVGMIATLAGWILILLGAALFLLPLANWQINLRGRHPASAGA